MSSPSSSADAENQNLKEKGEEATWWCKILVKVVAGIAVFACASSAIFTFIDILHPLCIVSGCLMIAICFIIILFELPLCCQCFEVTKGFADFTTKIKYWQKGLLYITISIPPVALCFGLSTILGCIVPFATGVIYGLMSIGKKANRGEMMASAGNENNMSNFTKFENEAE